VRTLNLGILAHVDAGKTSLTERLLHAAGVIDEIGSVDAGSTQTDSLALERRRGITIKTAVASLTLGDVGVNLIDTPGHPDFIAEVERSLSVLDGAVLVVSAVEGVQAQTRVLMRALQRLRVPTLIHVNKIDRRGASRERVLDAIAAKLSPAIVVMGSTHGLGTRAARFVPYRGEEPVFARSLTDRLAEHDDRLLAAYVEDEAALSHARLRAALADQTARALVHPVFFGSAITGAGVDALSAGIAELLPAADGDADGPVAAAVFKVERGPAGEKVAVVRMRSGTVRTRDRLRFHPAGEGKVTAIRVFERGGDVPRPAIGAGQVGRLWGLADVRIGDALGEPPARGEEGGSFAPPTLETVVLPRRAGDRGALYTALTRLAEQDPLIGLRHEDVQDQLSVSLYGEVQKEVIQATLAEEFGVEVDFRETTTICVERPVGTGAAFDLIGDDANPYLATVGLRVAPAEPGAGSSFGLEVELGSMPSAFMKAVEETVTATLRQGVHGWQVLDCAVTMTHSGFWARQSHSHATFDRSMSSTAGDFRKLCPLVLMTALQAAGTQVYEPIHRFRLEAPADTVGAVLSTLAQLLAVPGAPEPHGPAFVLEGDLPAARVHTLEQRLPGLTRGEGLLESAFDRHEPVRGAIPSRPRTDADPRDRAGYLRRVPR
jgi:ribosomal protection tetracycline resistance protein